MPLWIFYLPRDALSKTEKAALAKNITQGLLSTYKIPAFWTIVAFHDLPEGDFYASGETPAKAVFCVISGGARGFGSEGERSGFHDWIDGMFRPVFAPRQLTCEYNIRFAAAPDWRINGMVPPVPWGDDAAPKAYGEWLRSNEPIVYGSYVAK